MFENLDIQIVPYVLFQNLNKYITIYHLFTFIRVVKFIFAILSKLRILYCIASHKYLLITNMFTFVNVTFMKKWKYVDLDFRRWYNINSIADFNNEY